MKIVGLIKEVLIKPVENLFFPSVCFICHASLPENQSIICHACSQSLSRFNDSEYKILGKVYFNRLFITFQFEPKIQMLIHLLKYQRYLSIAELFAEKIIHFFPEIDSTKYHLLIPVPLHKIKFRERGYNQSEVISYRLSKITNIKCEKDLLVRIRNTKSQTKLNRKQRIENVSDAFKCEQNITGKNILLVDDVITTGSTVNFCSKVLKNAGAKNIDVLAISSPGSVQFSQPDDLQDVNFNNEQLLNI